jgi:hypothetical protein
MKRYRIKNKEWFEEIPTGGGPRNCVNLEKVDNQTSTMLTAALESCQGDVIDVVVEGSSATVRCKSGGILSVSVVTL